MAEQDTYKLVRNQDALEYCKKQSMLEQMVGEEKWKHYEYAAKALKKQIPLKPTTFGKDLFDCAFCGRVLEKHSHNYCPKCGQKLDWSK